VQRLDSEKRRFRNVAVGHHNEVDVAPVGFELSERDRALEIESDEAAPQNGLARRRGIGLEQRVDVGCCVG